MENVASLVGFSFALSVFLFLFSPPFSMRRPFFPLPSRWFFFFSFIFSRGVDQKKVQEKRRKVSPGLLYINIYSLFGLIRYIYFTFFFLTAHSQQLLLFVFGFLFFVLFDCPLFWPFFILPRHLSFPAAKTHFPAIYGYPAPPNPTSGLPPENLLFQYITTFAYLKHFWHYLPRAHSPDFSR